jgi:predicted metalloprotease
MKWRNERRSSNVEDKRGGGKALPIAGGGAIIIAIIYIFLGKDPSGMLQNLQQNNQSTEVVQTPHEDTLAQMSSVVLASTEDVWREIFQKMGRQYEEPKLVLFSNSIQSECGFAEAATGPFYCSGDNKVYLDLSFFDELGTRFGASGDFAQAYVIAHEVGHHIQNLLGTLQQVHQKQSELSEAQANKLSVRLELQADFYAGLWAHYADKYKNILEPGDIEEALNAASMIGDDRLQKQGQGYVVPETFTHGTSAQRNAWFNKGYQTGDFKQGDTFAAQTL